MPTGKYITKDVLDRWTKQHVVDGLSAPEIAKLEGLKASTVFGALKRLGVHVKRRTKSPRCAFSVNRPDASKAERFRVWNLRHNYDMTLEDFDRMVVAQGGCCAICKRLPSEVVGHRGPLHIDHDHEAGVVRGLLCHQCNTSIGKMQDDPGRLRAAADYIEFHRAPARKAA